MSLTDKCDKCGWMLPITGARLGECQCQPANPIGISARGPIQEPDRVQVLPPPLTDAMLEAGAMQYAMCAQRVQTAEKCAQDIYLAMEAAK